MRIFLTGGAVRDSLLGLSSHDIDFACEASSFDEMMLGLEKMNLKIWLIRPEFVTVRGQLPFTALAGKFIFTQNTETIVPGVVNADFTLCRAETMYSDKRHPDTVTPTTIQDDLKRRDFTMNAIAMSEDGTLLDPHKGQKDLKAHILRTVGFPRERFREDPLRILRALRFMVTLVLRPDPALKAALDDEEVVNGLGVLPVERIREELNRGLSVSWREMIEVLVAYPKVSLALARWHDPLWIRATTEEK